MSALALMTALAAFAAQAEPVPAPVRGAEWQLVAEDLDGRYFLDPASLSRDGNLARFRIRAEARAGGVNGVHLALFGVVIDCARRTSGFESGQLFDAGGRQLNARQVAPNEVQFEPIRAGSSEDQVFPRVCATAGH